MPVMKLTLNEKSRVILSLEKCGNEMCRGAFEWKRTGEGEVNYLTFKSSLRSEGFQLIQVYICPLTGC